ncbi:MAG: flagellin [Ignavibacteriota bacterium]
MFGGISPAGQQFVNNVNNIQSSLNQAEQQVSTGFNLSQPSDAPDEVSPVLQLLTQIDQNQSMNTNLTVVQANVNAAESALSSSVDLLQSASTMAAEATGPNETASTRQAMAQSVQALMQEMVSNSQAQVNGQYVFSGDQSGAPLYQLNLDAPNGVDKLGTASNTNLVQLPDGSKVSVTLSANSVFDDSDAAGVPTANNVFAALNGLRVALLNNDTTGITNSMTALQSASNYMNTQLAKVGSSQNTISSALTDNQNDEVQLRTQLSGLRDANMVEAITALTQGQTQLQAALSAQARLPTTTLFNFLPNS